MFLNGSIYRPSVLLTSIPGSEVPFSGASQPRKNKGSLSLGKPAPLRRLGDAEI